VLHSIHVERHVFKFLAREGNFVSVTITYSPFKLLFHKVLDRDPVILIGRRKRAYLDFLEHSFAINNERVRRIEDE
jgi:hypothetical protein